MIRRLGSGMKYRRVFRERRRKKCSRMKEISQEYKEMQCKAKKDMAKTKHKLYDELYEKLDT